MTMTLALPVDAKPVCADPEWLPIVDKAFARQGGPEAKLLATRACPRCPVGNDCLLFAMRNGEPGPWGGTSSHLRTRHGGKSPHGPGGWPTNLTGIDHGRDRRTDRKTA